MIISRTANDAANLTSAQLIEAVGGLPSQKTSRGIVGDQALRARLANVH